VSLVVRAVVFRAVGRIGIVIDIPMVFGGGAIEYPSCNNLMIG